MILLKDTVSTIFGAGAIGGHLASCLYEAGHKVCLISRGAHFEAIKKSGLRITIKENEKLISDKVIKENERFNIVNSSDLPQSICSDYLFITVKLQNYNTESLEQIRKLASRETAVIPPSTKIPFWWFYNYGGASLEKNLNNIEIDPEISRYIIRENIIGMTMWVSAVIDSPGHVVVKHIQRGYPLKSIYKSMDKKAEELRKDLNMTCKSPEVNSIQSELYIKSINSFAFNAIAILTEYTNYELSYSQRSQEMIRKIMSEGDNVIKELGLNIEQDIDSRISQTLSSTHHTMSMLRDYLANRPVELAEIWDGLEKLSTTAGAGMPYSKSIMAEAMYKLETRKKSI